MYEYFIGMVLQYQTLESKISNHGNFLDGFVDVESKRQEACAFKQHTTQTIIQLMPNYIHAGRSLHILVT